MVSVVMGRILHVFFFKTNSIANYGYDIINKQWSCLRC